MVSPLCSTTPSPLRGFSRKLTLCAGAAARGSCALTSARDCPLKPATASAAAAASRSQYLPLLSGLQHNR